MQTPVEQRTPPAHSTCGALVCKTLSRCQGVACSGRAATVRLWRAPLYLQQSRLTGEGVPVTVTR